MVWHLQILFLYCNKVFYKVKENLSYVIGVLSSILIPNNEWPEIFAFVMNKCQSTDGNEVEQGMILLSAICDSLGSALEPFIAPIMEILSKLIVVQHIHIQTLVVKTINSIMISNITTDSLIKFSALVPQMIQTVLMLPSNESLLHNVFDTLSDLIDLAKILVPHLPILINTALTIAVNK